MQNKILIIVFLLLIGFGIPIVGTGQEAEASKTIQLQSAEAATSTNVDETASQLEKLKSQLAGVQLDESQLKAVNASLTVVESNIRRATTTQKQTQEIEQLIGTAEQRAQAQRKAVTQLAETANDEVAKSANLETVERETKEQLSQAQKELDAVQATISSRRESTKTRPQTIAELRKQLRDLEEKLSANSSTNENVIVTEAKQLELRSTWQCIAAEIDRLSAEARLADAEEKVGMLAAKNDYSAAKVKRLKDRLETVQSRLEEQRRIETIQSGDQAQADVMSVPDVLKNFAEKNAEIAKQAKSLLQPLTEAQSKLKAETRALDQLQKQFKSTQNRVQAVGLTTSVGSYLRTKKSEIPHEGWLKPILVDRLSDIEKYQSDLFDLVEAEQSLISEEVVNQILANANADQLSSSERERLVNQTEKLITRRRELLSQAIKNHSDYLSTLEDLKNTEKELSELTTRFHEYISERILWIRSNSFLFSNLEFDELNADLIKGSNWFVTGQNLVRDIKENLSLYLATTFAFLVLFYYRIRMRHAIVTLSRITTRGTNTAFLPTIKTALLTVGVALPFPLLLGVVGWRMSNVSGGTNITVATGWALSSAAWFYFSCEFVRQVCRKDGLAASHFGWAESSLAKLKRELAWYIPVGTFFSFVCSLVYLVNLTELSDTIERVCFILGIGSLTLFLFRVFHPDNGVFREQVAKYPKSSLVQSRKTLFWLMLAFPLSLIAMIVVGYYYSAVEVLNRLYLTIIAVVVLEILRSLVLKFVQLSRRKARIAQSRARLAALSPQTDTESGSPNNELDRIADLETYLASENEAMDEDFERSRKLVSSAVAAAWVIAALLIWSDVFPALKGLDRYVFWTTTVDKVVEDSRPAYSWQIPTLGVPKTKASEPPSDATVEDTKQENSDDGNATSVAARSNVTQIQQPVTLRHFLIACFILVVSIFAVKNVPAFIELVFLKHSALEQSLRYAVKAISGYVILMAGVILAGRAMSIGWSQIQWLVTALTFGLAFGLQEIFANFIAGIILLLERPIRIGDIVQVDDVSGVVTRIRIRATTIRNFDRKELVIPNKDFITGRLLNWTLADKTLRQTIRVGVAYGSDVRKAKEIIRQICENHPSVLTDPAPIIAFEEFADSSLTITARVYLKEFEIWFTTLDEINLAIDDAFKQAGIEIAFPQRDLHIKSASSEFARAVSGEASIDNVDFNGATNDDNVSIRSLDSGQSLNLMQDADS